MAPQAPIPGVFPLPSVGWVHRTHDDSPITIGLAVVPIAGVKTNFPASTTNPILLPQSNTAGVPGGLGRVYTEAGFLQVAPSISVALSENLAVGIGPTLTLGETVIDPLVVSPLDDSDGSGAGRYGSGRGTRYAWGGGVQLGVYYITDNCWHVGASIKSPQWMEDFRYNTEDELGRPRQEKYDLDLPMIVSLGGAYSGFEKTDLALDLRYIDFRNTDGLGSAGFRPDGSLIGIDQSNVFAMAIGAQYELREGLTARLGYTFNQSPMQSSDTTLAVLAPLFYQHQLGAGASLDIAKNVSLNFAYTHYFAADLTGPILTPAGPVPGSSVTVEESAHNASLGVRVKY